VEPDLFSIAELRSLFLQEIAVCVAIVALIFCNLFKSTRAPFFVSIIFLAIHLALFCKYDPFRMILSLSAMLTIVMSGRQQRVEFFILILSTLLGADLMIKSNNFIMVLLSMELVSISSYVLTAGFSADKRRAEAAWKFFIYGSVATAVMIFGMTYVYGASGSLSIGTSAQSNLGQIGGLMLVGGVLLKIFAGPC
jgi:NADH:ubiquinone oxidoreductase subunit 2 (subunit N)